ncbi:MAG TPA: transcriptional repressor [Thermoleophilaceae bacterium]
MASGGTPGATGAARRTRRPGEDQREQWVAHAFERLAEAGNRGGAARAAVVETIGSEGGCLTADEVYDRLRARGDQIGTASVYRALGLLSELRLLHGASLPGGATRYELVLPHGDHHHHVVCDRCGRTVAFEDRALESAIARLSERLDYDVHAHDVTLRGVCPGCS